eukprot:CAMPEP_0195134436 /NCGR_PEP_ID=MMETSP0448-20130528/150653_1 /TAXON_ID=66468 /ORGANISM="Heterocapsa triquestra, Strain CCMP 448" /LENGTH=84 /DNA_ID=CAMNT_0040172537 /DNA_START=46 /DNA_END=297 /DNA_ORIENTATION=-
MTVTWFAAMLLLGVAAYVFHYGQDLHLFVPLTDAESIRINLTNCDLVVVDEGVMSNERLGVSDSAIAPFLVAHYFGQFFIGMQD